MATAREVTAVVRLATEVGLRTLATRAQLGSAMERRPPTVTGYVNTLRAAGVLAADDVHFKGDSSGYLKLKNDLYTVIGIELHHNGGQIVLCGAAYEPLLPARTVNGRDIEQPRNTLGGLGKACDVLLRAARVPPDRPLAFGLALPAPVDRHEGRTASPHILAGWSTIEPAAALGEDLARRGWTARGLINNDASLGALGMRVLDAPRRRGQFKTPLVYVRVTDGVGAGVATHLGLLDGARGLAGEIGHLKMDERGPLCPRCGGVGCLETLASNRAILDKLKGRGILEDDENATIAQVIASSHPACIRALRDAGWQVGRALAHLTNLLNPADVVIGGEVSRSEPFLDWVRRALRRDALPEAQPEVRPAPEGALSPELAGALADAGTRKLLHPTVSARVRQHLS
jgi:predicted NBD/HSP70 family sugar kinase